MSRTIEQRRAAFALKFIDEFIKAQETQSKDDTKKAKEKLSTHIHKMPSLILQCGLGQALGFLLADAGGKSTPSKMLYEILQNWLCGTSDDEHPIRVYSQSQLMEALVTGDKSHYFRAQEESLLLLNWLKKFAAAKL